MRYYSISQISDCYQLKNGDFTFKISSLLNDNAIITQSIAILYSITHICIYFLNDW